MELSWEIVQPNDEVSPLSSSLLADIAANENKAEALCIALNAFLYRVAVGYAPTTHGDRPLQEVREKCAKPSRGKPALLQEIARLIIEAPNHKGVARAVKRIEELCSARTPGFGDVKIDYRRELRDAVRLGDYEDPDEAMAEQHRRRSYARPSPPPTAISTIHKAKGLECEHAILLPCDGARYSATPYAKCKLYVALSRARRSLTLVVDPNNPGPLFKI